MKIENLSNITKLIFYKLNKTALITALHKKLKKILKTNNANKNNNYTFSRIEVDQLEDDKEKEFVRLLNILNYTKTKEISYSAKTYPAGYHTITLLDKTILGQRNPFQRFSKIPLDFFDKRVLDIGTNQGGMLFSIHEQISFGVGLDYDPRMINSANRISSLVKTNNLFFFVFDIEKEPLELILDLIPGGRVDIILLLSVCKWISNWRSVINFCAKNAPIMLFESNGNIKQQYAQEKALNRYYSSVSILADSSEDDPLQKNRKLFLCQAPRK